MAKRVQKYVPKVTGEIIHFVISNGYKIYPISEIELNYIRKSKPIYSIPKPLKWFIEVNYNGTIKTFNKAILNSEITEALDKTIMHFYNELKNKKK